VLHLTASGPTDAVVLGLDPSPSATDIASRYQLGWLLQVGMDTSSGEWPLPAVLVRETATPGVTEVFVGIGSHTSNDRGIIGDWMLNLIHTSGSAAAAPLSARGVTSSVSLSAALLVPASGNAPESVGALPSAQEIGAPPFALPDASLALDLLRPILRGRSRR
jgi:hypothetical protein